MTVKQLKNELNQFPDDMEVYLTPSNSEFEFGPVESVKSERIRFHEGITKGLEAKYECVILSEEV